MQCSICEHNPIDCECTHHEQAAYEKGRNDAIESAIKAACECDKVHEVIRAIRALKK